MINKSGENGNMMEDLNLNFQDDEDIDFYNNLQRVVDNDQGSDDNEGYRMDDYEDIFDDPDYDEFDQF